MTKTSKITAAKVFITLLNLGMLALACVYFKDLPRVVLMSAIVIFAT